MAASGSSRRPKLSELQSRKLRELGARRDINDSKELVQAYNKATDPLEQTLLLHWLGEYVPWFSAQQESRLSPNIIESYASLAYIVCRGPRDSELIRRFISSLVTKLKESEYYEYNIIATLEYALTVVDPMILKNKITELLKLVPVLSSYLDPEVHRFTRTFYINHALTLFALHRTLVILQTVAPGQISDKILDDLMERMKAIEESAKYYPYIFIARLIKSSIKSLKEHNAPSPSVILGRRLFHGLCGTLYMIQGLGAITKLELDLDAIESGCKHFKEVIRKSDRNKWTPQLQDLMEASEKCLKDDNFSHFREAMAKSIEKSRRWIKEKNGKMLRFCIISQLCMIVVEGHSMDIRKEAMEELSKLASRASATESRIKEPHLFEAMLDALYAIHKNCKEHSHSSLNAIEEVISIAKDQDLKEKAKSWKCDIRDMEKLLDANVDQENEICDELFEAVRIEMGLTLTWKDVQRNIDNLKNFYQSRHFSEVPTLFNQSKQSHVKDFEYNIVRYEEVPIVKKRTDDDNENHLIELVESMKRVSKRVALGDIMKPKEVREGTILSSKDRKYLLVGNPGTGKTSLSKSLAYRWATGNLGCDFEAVYILYVRRLRNASLGEQPGQRDLVATIINECFLQRDYSDDALESLKKQIDDDLEKTTTLLIIDGLDEADETGSATVREALKCNCHILMTSRPYNLTGIRQEVGMEMECFGFDDDQLKHFVKNEVNEGSEDLLNHLLGTPSMWEVAHVPITAGILCCIWNEKPDAHTPKDVLPKNRLFLYDQMVNFVWERYVKKLKASGSSIPDRNIVFDALKTIAFHSRNEGEILISELLVRAYAPDGDTSGMLQDSGFILLQLEGTKYQFTHLTFQEYYAALFLAENLLEVNQSNLESALNFVAKNKYKEIHRDTLKFMMQRMAVKYGNRAIVEAFEIIDQEPRDVLGVQHTMSKLQMVDAFLSVKEDALKNQDCYCSCKKVVDSASEMFCNLKCNKEHCEWIIRHAEQSSTVSKRFPELITPFVKKNLKKSKVVRAKLFEIFPALGRACPAILPVFEEFLSPSSSKNEKDLEGFFENSAGFPVDPSDVEISIADILSKAYRDSSYEVRIAACETLGGFIRNSPFSVSDVKIAIIKRFHWLSRILLSDVINVRCFAMEEIKRCAEHDYDLAMTLWSLMSETSGNEDEQNVLDKGFDDENKDVRSSAMEAFIAFAVQLQDQATYPREKISIGCCDPEDIVRYSIAENLGRLAESGEDNAKFAWRLLSRFLEDKDLYVRQTTVSEAATVALAASINEASVRKRMIVRLTEEEAVGIRLDAMITMKRLVTDDMDESEGLVEILVQTCDDGDFTIRKEACDLLASIAKKAPTLREPCLNILETKCEDEEQEVRDTARGHLLYLSPHRCPEKYDSAVLSIESEDSECSRGELITEEERVEHFKSLLKKCRGDTGSIEEIKKSAGTVQNSEEMMIEAASTFFRNSNSYTRLSGTDLLKLVVERSRKSEKIPNCAMQVTTLAVEAATTETRFKGRYIELIKLLPLEWLFDYYWSSHDDKTGNAMTDRLLDIAVTVFRNDNGQESKLVIYEASDEIEYVRSSEDLQCLVWLMQSAVPGTQPQQSYILPSYETVEPKHKKKKQKTTHQDSENSQ